MLDGDPMELLESKSDVFPGEVVCEEVGSKLLDILYYVEMSGGSPKS